MTVSAPKPHAATAADALGLVAIAMPDIAVIDLGLPDLPGEEVAAHLRALDARVRLIAITGGIASDEQAAHFDHVLKKPFALDDLLRLL